MNKAVNYVGVYEADLEGLEETLIKVFEVTENAEYFADVMNDFEGGEETVFFVRTLFDVDSAFYKEAQTFYNG